jgi:hypothetical protein
LVRKAAAQRNDEQMSRVVHRRSIAGSLGVSLRSPTSGKMKTAAAGESVPVSAMAGGKLRLCYRI